MQRGPLLAILLTAMLLAGCAGPADAPTDHTQARSVPPECANGCGPQGGPSTATTAAPDTMSIHGVVMDDVLHTLPDATVVVRELNLTKAVGPAGTFAFDGLVPSTYFLTASAPEHRSQTLTVEPANAQETVHFALEPLATNLAYNETVHFHGHLQCALEALIITPSCDSVITTDPVNHAPVLNDTFSAQLPVAANWKTVVTDVVFDPSAQPGMAGLRVTVRGAHDAHSLGSYEEYGKFNGTKSFTFSVEPDTQYDGGTRPVPSNTTQFQFDTYPLSYGWHKVCQPGTDTCFLGVGAGLDVDFDLYMTTFYVEPAPAGWTLQ
ncbi:MAG: carboxypeptidase regulatory-like domain-containing protein [Thermoplasmatota archaeon]